MNGSMAELNAWIGGFWQQRTEQERRTLKIAAVALFLLLGYQLVWMPLQHAVQREEARLVDARELAQFAAQARLTLSRSTPSAVQKIPTGSSQMPPMLWVEQAAQTMGIQNELVQRQPEGDDRVQLKFAAVSFDTLLLWLARAHEVGLQVIRADVTPQAGNPAHPEGRVDATLLLGRASGS